MNVCLPKDKEHYVLDNMKLVHYYARRLCPSKNDYDDYVQEGMIGLILAANRFDESKGYKFRTYAGHLICGHMKDYARDRLHLISLPRSLITLRHKIAKYLEEYPNASESEICKALDISSSKYAESISPIECESLDALISDDESSHSIEQIIPDTGYLDRIQGEQDEDALIDAEDRVVMGLSKRNRDLYDDYFYSRLFGDNITFADLGRKYNITQSRISQLVKKINKLVLEEYRKN